MSIRNLIFGVNSVTVSELFRYDSLLQNATAILSQNVTVFFSDFLLQNATVLLPDATIITKCNVYYKLRLYSDVWLSFEDILCITSEPVPIKRAPGICLEALDIVLRNFHEWQKRR